MGGLRIERMGGWVDALRLVQYTAGKRKKREEQTKQQKKAPL